jgi:hypothetical protein
VATEAHHEEKYEDDAPPPPPPHHTKPSVGRYVLLLSIPLLYCGLVKAGLLGKEYEDLLPREHHPLRSPSERH